MFCYAAEGSNSGFKLLREFPAVEGDGSSAGAETAAILFSVTSTCHRHHIDAFAYIKDLLERLAHAALSICCGKMPTDQSLQIRCQRLGFRIGVQLCQSVPRGAAGSRRPQADSDRHYSGNVYLPYMFGSTISKRTRLNRSRWVEVNAVGCQAALIGPRPSEANLAIAPSSRHPRRQETPGHACYSGPSSQLSAPHAPRRARFPGPPYYLPLRRRNAIFADMQSVLQPFRDICPGEAGIAEARR